MNKNIDGNINWELELSGYIKQNEANKSEKATAWETAIGLQEVDGLKPSKYLIETAKEHIEGKIDINEVNNRINDYYKVQDKRVEIGASSEEADKVSARITEILGENAFNFSHLELLNIHKRLFDGIFKGAGIFRKYNITKKEWVLNGDTVIYSPYETIEDTLKYDFEQEKNFSYKDLNLEDAIKHLCKFVSNIWQIHPFCEGNTRTTAIFLIKYLRTFGFNINNDTFIKHSWYFRNALVRANYNSFDKNVFADISYLEKFFYNLLTKTNYQLKNRYIHVDYINKDAKIKKNNLTIEEQAIINLIQNNPLIKQEDIANELGKSLRTIKTYMSSMQEKGFIERKNGKRNGEWIINI